ncbi:hypothetical protein F5X97DRAFT_323761 [Nemania serpens]|nr:hypothetical protein F5X97DRAFT_323761 [Nemania serpens]
MSQPKVIQLLPSINDMRIYDTAIDLDDEANTTANAMYSILQDEYEWAWPNETKHLMAWNDDRGECAQGQEESDEDYQVRAVKWNNWPNLRTKWQAQWLRCAIITSRALRYLCQCRAQVEYLRICQRDGGEHTYRSQRCYKYVWICLNQGYGERVWKTKPPMPSETEQNVDLWFMSTAQHLVDKTVKAWEAGSDLDILIPILTLEDLFPSPADKEAIAVVSAKLKAAEKH